MTFGEKLKNARKNSGLTQKELANMIGAKHNSVSNWELDQNKPDPDTIELLCRALGITPNYLLMSSATDSPPVYTRNLNIPPILQKVKFAFGINDDDDLSQSSLNILAGVYKTLRENEKREREDTVDDN